MALNKHCYQIWSFLDVLLYVRGKLSGFISNLCLQVVDVNLLSWIGRWGLVGLLQLVEISSSPFCYVKISQKYESCYYKASQYQHQDNKNYGFEDVYEGLFCLFVDQGCSWFCAVWG